jgi:hypothetical protein
MSERKRGWGKRGEGGGASGGEDEGGLAVILSH